MPPKVQYEKLSLHDQILLRPDTYVGSMRNAATSEPVYTFVGSSFADGKIQKETIMFPDGLLRIFIEAVSNSIDNVWRSMEEKIIPKFIKINIDEKTGKVTVWNDGKNIPTGNHPTENIPIPELIFGNLLTSSNYNDSEERRTSGKNGLGIKACSIFSEFFEVEIYNAQEKVIYTQEWRDNMKTKGDPVIKTKGFPKTLEEGKNGYTKVSFIPDFKRFGLKGFEFGILSQMKKTVLDCALTVSFNRVQTYFNDTLVPIRTLEDYIRYYIVVKKQDSNAPSAITSPQQSDSEESDGDESDEEEKVDKLSTLKVKRTEEEVMTFTTGDSKVYLCAADEWTHISFVNGIFTKDGGCHVDAWSEAIFRPVLTKINGSKKKDKLDIRDIKKHFFLFVFCSLDKPTFDSQSKTKLNGPDVKPDVKDAQLRKILKWGFVKKIEDSLKLKEMLTLKKTTERKKGQSSRIEKLDDAKYAGKKPEQCYLLAAEGASAKTYIIQGMKYGIQGKKGRDFIGVMELKGKILNTRNASSSQIGKNKEVIGLIQALGLQYDVDYTKVENRKKLRYHHFVAATDSDSVSEDTPLLLKNKNGEIEIKRIDSIANEQNWTTNVNSGKEYNTAEYEVWTEQGWTKIKHVMRHLVTKKMYRVNTHTGIVDVTEDHSLIRENGEEVAPKELKVDDYLLHSYPEREILQSSAVIGDLPYSFSDECTIVETDKLEAAHIFFVAKYLGYHVTLDACDTERIFIRISTKKEDTVCNTRVKKIVELEHKEQYVYDLETENHHFQAGVGQLIVHNTDGFHITGLLYNFFHSLFPTVLQIPGFFSFMRVPIVKINYRNKELSFFYQEQARKYIEEHKIKNDHIRYFKGLGTANNKDIEHDFGRRIVQLNPDENADKMIVNVFDKDQTEFRKRWLTSHTTREVFPDIKDYAIEHETVTDFLNLELINFSVDDCKRSIPALLDGMKESYRKILYAAFKRNLKHNGKSLKVAQFAGYVAENTNYHHGEMNLFDTIIGMAQRFVGSNNIPLLVNDGQHGCLDPETEILMWDGSKKKAKDIVVGDKLVGDDGTDRTVQQLTSGVDDMYQITTLGTDRNTYTVNSQHILTLYDAIKSEVIDIKLVDYISLPKYEQEYMYSIKKDTHLRFEVNYIGKGPYNGWSLDKNQRFVLGNFIVTHNSRLLNGADAANGRYIFTKLEEITRLLFRPEDDDYLVNNIDDGDVIEKEYYCPVLPMVLINPTYGGIGTGWSCNIPGYHPKQCIEWIDAWLSAKEGKTVDFPTLTPFYRGFKGTIKVEGSTITTFGVLAKLKNGNYRITEIPIGRRMMSIEKYKEKLLDLKDEGIIKDIVSDDHTDEIVDFTVSSDKQLDHKMLYLIDTISTNNMVCFNSSGKLRKYANTDSILDEYCEVRYKLYHTRKEGEIRKMEDHIQMLESKIGFIGDVVTKKIDLQKLSDEELHAHLVKQKVRMIDDSYEYLLSMQVRSMTKTKMEHLREQLEKEKAILEEYRKISPADMWRNECKEIEKHITF